MRTIVFQIYSNRTGLCRTRFVLLFILFAFGKTKAQSDTSRLKLWSIGGALGFNVASIPPPDEDEQRKIAPASSLLDSSGLKPGRPRPDNLAILCLSAYAEFTPYNKKKKRYCRSKISMGGRYEYYTFSGLSYFRSSLSPVYDTLYSSYTDPFSGNTYYDTSYAQDYINESRDFYLRQHFFLLDFNQVFHSNPKRQISAGIGYGIQAGTGIHGRVRINYMISRSPPWWVSPNMKYSGKQETEKTKTSFSFRLYVPVIFQLRLSRRENIWNHFSISLEYRFGLVMLNIPGLKMSPGFYFNNSYGFKYYLCGNAVKPRRRSAGN